MSDDENENSLDYQRDPIYIDQDMLRMVARAEQETPIEVIFT